MKVKICGITTGEAAIVACEAGADLLGFVFARSSREITPEKAAAIVKQIPSDVATVGVFVNETLENIERIAKEVNLDFVQLHGDESPEFCQRITIPVIKAFKIREKEDVTRINQYDCDYYLVDSPGIQYAGGSGVPFDWSLLADENIPREKIIVAGGLNKENVAEAIRRVQPAGVDVSSGVETNGQKDHEKIIAFIKEAKENIQHGTENFTR